MSDTSQEIIEHTMDRNGIDMDRDCWIAGALACDVTAPDTKLVHHCRPNVTAMIRDLDPRQIIMMGMQATKSVIDPLSQTVKTIDKWAGYNIPHQAGNRWLSPMRNPAVAGANRDDNKRNSPVEILWLRRQLSDALKMQGRPWDGRTIPDYTKDVRMILDPSEGARWIRQAIQRGGPISFDLETDRLKAGRYNGQDGKIYSVGFCHLGTDTVAMPFAGEIITAFKEFLRSPMPKIGANCKFEEQWCRTVCGEPVRNWVWDCMLSAHHQDNRPGITSVKFQAFVLLGLGSWNSVIQSYLEADDAVTKNRIHEVDLNTLLKYNGVDALVEFKIAELQRKRMHASAQN